MSYPSNRRNDAYYSERTGMPNIWTQNNNWLQQIQMQQQQIESLQKQLLAKDTILSSTKESAIKEPTRKSEILELSKKNTKEVRKWFKDQIEALDKSDESSD